MQRVTLKGALKGLGTGHSSFLFLWRQEQWKRKQKV